MGFGTKNLQHYGYSKIGTPVIYERGKRLAHNLTCIATISDREAEMLQFIYTGGTKNEIFEHYYDKLVRSMKVKYPNKKLVFVLDNLRAHKSSLIMKI